MKSKDLKKEEKIAKKIIRYRHANSTFYKYDKYLKLTKVKVKEMHDKKKIDGGNEYKIKYQYGFNMFNPLTLLLILTVIITEMLKVAKESLIELKATDYLETIKIKN